MYVPDFYLPTLGIYVECKGRMTEIAQRKIDCFEPETDETLILVFGGEFYKEFPSFKESD